MIGARGWSPTDRDRFEQARSMGPLALYRLRAEVLLDGDTQLSGEERELLERIAVVPNASDGELLGRFDRFFEGV
jgi:hypothetical protein